MKHTGVTETFKVTEFGHVHLIQRRIVGQIEWQGRSGDCAWKRCDTGRPSPVPKILIKYECHIILWKYGFGIPKEVMRTGRRAISPEESIVESSRRHFEIVLNIDKACRFVCSSICLRGPIRMYRKGCCLHVPIVP